MIYRLFKVTYLAYKQFSIRILILAILQRQKKMKKTLLSIALFGIVLINVSAQCTPDNNLNSTGVYFNESNIPCINDPYSETIQMSIKNDTTVNVFGNSVTVLMDSVKINSVTGIPDGLDYTCENTECKIIRNSLQTHTQTCIVIAGTPTTVGDFDITFNATIYVQGSALNKDFVVSSSVNNCINGIQETNAASIDVFPQPSNGNTTLEINMNSSESVNIQILNMNGEIMDNAFNSVLKSGKNQIDISQYTSGLLNGVYLLNMQFENNTISKKLIIE